ncbi:TnsA-like heteromeric transposase endonuclease subunit [Streptomyces sp. NPDC015184]|uniref:TnsA-like heteromeric transposase endonuclease subunit n=1 Tax=Streptomyces sp. NPDC015184 TaxID=3364946 RepID=UPI0036F53FC0
MKFGQDKVVWPVRDLASAPAWASRPVRSFTWRAGQRHRPGLQFMLSTGRMHGFESLEEQDLLLALDFLEVLEVLSQPFCLDFEQVTGRMRHTPDFLAFLPGGGRWLFDVRPGGLIEEEDAVKFAAAGEAAAACGWRYTVVTEWRRHVLGTLDTLSSQRRPLVDQLGLQGQLLECVGRGPALFGDLVESTVLPAVARAHALHLLWHRRLAVSLDAPFGDGSAISLGAMGRSG